MKGFGTWCVSRAPVALAFLIPLLALPFTVDPFEMNKQVLWFFVIAVTAVLWCVMAFAKQQVTLRKHWIFGLLLLVLVAIGLACLFSVAPATSWLGQGAQEYGSFLTVIAGALLFFVGGHVLTAVAAIRRVSVAAILSGTILGAFALLNTLHIPLGLFVNPVGTPNALAFTLLTLSLFGMGAWISATGDADRDLLPIKTFGLIVRGCITLTTVAAVTTLLMVDYSAFWWIAVVGTALLLALGLARAPAFNRILPFLLPMTVFVTALIFAFAPTFLTNIYPPEVSPTTSTSWQIVQGSWDDHTMWLGSGPGTFSVDYAKHYPEVVNNTIFWDTRFDRGSSAFLTLLATTGVLGTGAFLFFVGALWFLGLQALSSKDANTWRVATPLMVAFGVLTAGFFVYPTNITLVFLFWLFATLLAGALLPKPTLVTMNKSPRTGLVMAFSFVIVGIALLTLTFLSVTRYSAEVAYAQAVDLGQQTGKLDEVITKLDQAASRNRWNDVYYRNLAVALLSKVQTLAATPDQADPQMLRDYIGASINAAVRATDLGPLNVVNWALRSDIYRETAPVIGDAADFATASAQKAIDLSPSNPRFYVLLARAHIVRADLLQTLIDGDDETVSVKAKTLRDDALTLAETALTTSLTLKRDYATASYYLAFVKERQGDLAEAVKQMEVVRSTNTSDIGVGIQLALMYLRQGKNDLARAELNRLLGLAPNYANALWYLSVIDEKEGNISDAIANVKKVLETNPNDKNVSERLERLQNSAASTPAATLPVGELPTPVEEGDSDVGGATVLP